MICFESMLTTCYVTISLCLLDCGWDEDGVECWGVRHCCGGRGWDGGGVSPPWPGNCHPDRRPLPSYVSKYPFALLKS